MRGFFAGGVAILRPIFPGETCRNVLLRLLAARCGNAKLPSTVIGNIAIPEAVPFVPRCGIGRGIPLPRVRRPALGSTRSSRESHGICKVRRPKHRTTPRHRRSLAQRRPTMFGSRSNTQKRARYVSVTLPMVRESALAMYAMGAGPMLNIHQQVTDEVVGASSVTSDSCPREPRRR